MAIYLKLFHTLSSYLFSKSQEPKRMKNGDASSTKITIGGPSADTKGRSATAVPVATIVSKTRAHGGWKKGVAAFDFILRLCAIGASLAATTAMGTTDETLPFVTQFFQFQASYADLPALMFFVIGNAIAGGYLVLSLPFSILGILRPHALGLRLLLLLFDIVMVALTTASASAAAAIVYLAHNGNSNANWVAICQQFTDFCQQISSAVVASFIAAVILMLLVLLSALVLRKH